jgi:hypothetical protein
MNSSTAQGDSLGRLLVEQAMARLTEVDPAVVTVRRDFGAG